MRADAWGSRCARLLCGLSLLGLLIAGGAQAAPITYGFTTGSVDVTATAGATDIISAPGLPLTGLYVTFDADDPDGAGPLDATLVDLAFTAGPTGVISLLSPYAGNDGFSLDSLLIDDGGDGIVNLAVTSTGATTYDFTVSGLEVDATATPYVGAVPGAPIVVTDAASGPLSGSIDVSAGTLMLEGITLLVVPPLGGETDPLIVKGDFMFTGMEVVPEPGTALLLVVGAWALGRRRSAT